MRLTNSLGWAFFAVLCLTRGASADVILLIDDPATGIIDVIIADNAPFNTPTPFGNTTQADAIIDSDGTVAMSAAVTTTNWNISDITTGFGYGGGPDPAGVDLMMDATSVNAGSLTGTVVFTDAALDFELTNINSFIGGTTDGSGTVNYSVGFDDANGWYPPTVISATGLVGLSFGDSQTVSVTGTNPFSLSVTGTFNASGGGEYFFFDANGETNPVPEPTSLVLFGTFSGVGFCMAGYRRWRKKRSDAPAAPAG